MTEDQVCRFCRRRNAQIARTGKHPSRIQLEQCCRMCWETSGYWALCVKHANVSKSGKLRQPGFEKRIKWLASVGPVTEAACRRWEQAAFLMCVANGGDDDESGAR